MPPRYFLSIVIPAYKEKSRLRRSLPGLRDYLRNQDFSWEVIVVDDGSCDGTSEVPREVFSESGALKVLKNSGNFSSEEQVIVLANILTGEGYNSSLQIRTIPVGKK